MKKCLAVCIVFLLLNVQLRGQEAQDSVSVKMPQAASAASQDTTIWVKTENLELPQNAKLNTKPFKPDPTKAVIYSAIFPGLGQIYNRKYWKLPLVYGGFLGLSYAITWNGGYYNDYSAAYREMSGDDPRVNYSNWKPFLQNVNPGELTDSDIERFKSSFRRKRDFYRRNRDLAIIGTVALYAICMIDAYVDAHLFDFNMSDDLSLRVEPAIMNGPLYSNKTVGLQCSIKF